MINTGLIEVLRGNITLRTTDVVPDSVVGSLDQRVPIG